MKFKKITVSEQSTILGGASPSPYMTCKGTDKNGVAKCTPNYGAIRKQTGRTIVNGWVNYGPWQPRPRGGVIFP